MKAFSLLRPSSVEAAVDALATGAGALPKGGGVDLLDRMKERVDEPDALVALSDLSGAWRAIEEKDGLLVVGAGATLADLAASDVVRRLAPTLAEAAGLAASPQLRHRATLGGNLAQHTRCGYYRHRSFPCLKRGDDACPVRAPGGVQETAGIFGNDPCASAHPSSVAPVLGALGAKVSVLGPKGAREVAFPDLWRAPAKGVASDVLLEPGEVIRAVSVAPGGKAGYDEVRQKAAFDWPLVSAAVRYRLDGERIAEASVWLGAVAPTPWRAAKAEAALVGGKPGTALAEKAGEAAASDATPLPGNAYKRALVRVAVKRALEAARGRAS
jgi:xanthine dehydrogenase YagS FAD-binding subunit